MAIGRFASGVLSLCVDWSSLKVGHHRHIKVPNGTQACISGGVPVLLLSISAPQQRGSCRDAGVGRPFLWLAPL
jgi:hypothetical protein